MLQIGENIRCAVWKGSFETRWIPSRVDFILLYKLWGSSFYYPFYVITRYVYTILDFFSQMLTYLFGLIKSNNNTKNFFIFPLFYSSCFPRNKNYLLKILATYSNSGPSNIVLPFHECKTFPLFHSITSKIRI